MRIERVLQGALFGLLAMGAIQKAQVGAQEPPPFPQSTLIARQGENLQGPLDPSGIVYQGELPPTLTPLAPTLDIQAPITTPESPPVADSVESPPQALQPGQLEARPLSVEERINLELQEAYRRYPELPKSPFKPVVIDGTAPGDFVIYSFTGGRDLSSQTVFGVTFNENKRELVQSIVANGKKKDGKRAEFYVIDDLKGFYLIDGQKVPATEKANLRPSYYNPFWKYRWFGFEILENVIRGYYAFSPDAPVNDPSFLQWIGEYQLRPLIFNNLLWNRNGQDFGGLGLIPWEVHWDRTGINIFYVTPADPPRHE